MALLMAPTFLKKLMTAPTLALNGAALVLQTGFATKDDGMLQ
jgi:hypothetical protein